MTPNDFRAYLESELLWRQEELAFFKNQLNNISADVEKNRYRKSLVLLLYSHMEGFVKIALQTYIQYLNAQSLSRDAVTSGLMVAGMHREFLAYENLDRKCEVFRRSLPDDSKLHRLYRRVDFAESFSIMTSQPLLIEDTLVDTESNLWYIVLQKNLYKLGLPIDMFDSQKGDIDALVNRRNSIAHGNFHAGISMAEYANWETKIYGVLNTIIVKLYDYLNQSKYLKTP